LSADWPDRFQRTVEEAGYMRLAGCRHDVDHGCLWVRGKLESRPERVAKEG